MNEKELAQIQKSLAYAILQATDITIRHLIAQEFWHSLNRKKVVKNEEVDALINATLLSS